MSTEPFLGEIKPFGFAFAPRGYAYCDGSLLSVSANTALFSLLGTTYGGNGQTTFGLPDLRGRVMVGQGSGPGLTPIALGAVDGSENVTLTVNNLPPHNHSATSLLFAEGLPGDTANPNGNLLASIPSGYISPDPTPNAQLSSESVTTTIGVVGNGQNFPIRDPYLGLNMCIAIQGLFPSRN